MNLKRIGAGLLTCTLLIPLAGSASAQSMSLSNASSLLAATNANDESRSLLRYIFGSFSDNPFANVGTTPTSLLGNLFLYLNIFVFLIASLWTTYTITSGVVSTAHEGEFLGKRFSTVWYPIRLVWGAATLVPIFGGYSLGQAIYMCFTLVSVSAANTLSGAALMSMTTFTAMVPAPSGLPASTPLQSSIAEQMFYMWLCAETLAAQPLNQPDSMMQVTALGTANGVAPTPSSGSDPQNVGVQLGTAAHPDECGSAGVSLANSAAVVGSNSSMFGFTVDSVNYSNIVATIQSNVQQAHQSAMFALSSTMQGLATSWYQSYLTAKNAGSGNQIVPFPYAQIQAAKIQYDASVTQTLQQAAAASGVSSITKTALYNMQQLGWVGLGTWYQTFAEVNGALADASKVDFLFTPPDSHDTAWEEVYDEASKAKDLVYKAGQAGSGGENGVSTSTAIWYMRTLLCDGANTTGNWSIGQCLLHGMQWLVFQNTGGSQLVNPVIAAKNLGDSLMVSGEALWGVSALAASETSNSGFNLFAKAAEVVEDTATAGQSAVWRDLVQGAIKIVITFAGIIFSIGLVLSIYVPLIPFITWFSAILTWLAVVVEAIISASLWSLVHLEGEGEGMGQRTQHGYLFLMNVTFRAPLMVLSFFVASAMTIIGGTLLYQTFGSAISNAAGNSLVGLASIVGYLVILTGLMILVVQTSFNLIHLIPDQVLGWLGGNLGAHLGREMEGRIHGMFLAGGRNLQGGLTGALQKPQRPSGKPRGGSMGQTPKDAD
jgi:conjugal transfer/type IV secretion protein DotA/TraY